MDVEQQQDVSDIEDDKSPPCGSLHRVANGKNAFNASRVILFAGCFVGLQVSYLLWGLLQEKIMTTNYTATDSHPDTLAAVPSHRQLSTFTPLPTHALQADPLIRTFQFHDSQFLVLVNRVLAFVVAVMAIIAKRRINEKGTSYKKLGPLGSGKRFSIAPLHEFSFCSISNILSSWCQYEALKYVNFPTQVRILCRLMRLVYLYPTHVPFVVLCFNSVTYPFNLVSLFPYLGSVQSMQTTARHDHVNHHFGKEVSHS